MRVASPVTASLPRERKTPSPVEQAKPAGAGGDAADVGGGDDLHGTVGGEVEDQHQAAARAR